jgi:hypothetical protein
MYFVSITRLRLRSLLYLFPFMRYAIPSTQQSTTAAGNVVTRTHRQGFKVFWTFTVWDSEATMRQYMIRGAHRQAMPKLAQWCDEASTVHWLQASPALPDWGDIQQRMQTQGRMHPVRYPSENHAAGVLRV